MKKQNGLRALFIILCCITNNLQATLTTLQWWDPSPVYSALNNKPINTHCLDLFTYNEFNEPEKQIPLITVSITPFAQRAIRGQDNEGKLFGKTQVETTPAFDRSLGNFRGMPFLLGLFLGPDENGFYITGNTPTKASNNINDNNVSATQLPTNLKNTLIDSAGNPRNFAKILYDSSVSSTTIGTGDSTGVPTAGTNETTLFCEQTLYRVTTEFSDTPEYISCLKVDSEYMKAGVRFEFAINLSKNIDLLIQGGMVNVKHTLNQPVTSITLDETGTSHSAIYDYMWANNTAGVTDITNNQKSAKDAFNDHITHNIDALLADNGGISYEYKDFNTFQAEDVRLALSLKHPVVTNVGPRADEEDYAAMVFTPFLEVAASLPIGNTMLYKNALELSSGNNNHYSIGGTVGLVCDFVETIQVGLEAGYDHFFEATQLNRPCPNNQYQSILFPYKRDVITQPGDNIHFAVNMQAYKFLSNTNFYCSYEYIQHREDKHRLVTANSNFHPLLLDRNTAWNSQMFKAALNFDVTENFNFGIVGQFPVSQRNAFNSASIGGSLSFLF